MLICCEGVRVLGIDLEDLTEAFKAVVCCEVQYMFLLQCFDVGELIFLRRPSWSKFDRDPSKLSMQMWGGSPPQGKQSTHLEDWRSLRICFSIVVHPNLPVSHLVVCACRRSDRAV